MDENKIYQHMGETTSALKNVNDTLKTLNEKADKTLEFQSATEERLKSGNKKFEKHQEDIENHETRIQAREKLVCPKSPNNKTIYTLIVVGFTVLALLITFIK